MFKRNQFNSLKSNTGRVAERLQLVKTLLVQQVGRELLLSLLA